MYGFLNMVSLMKVRHAIQISEYKMEIFHHWNSFFTVFPFDEIDVAANII